MASFEYSSWLEHAVTILQVADPDGVTAFTALAPYFIERAEQLIYADPDLDFLLVRETDVSQITVSGARAVPVPPQMITIEGVSIVTPANTFPWIVGAQRIPLMRTSRQFIDFTWPNESQTLAPSILQGGYFALFDMQEGEPAPGEDDGSPLPSSFIISPTPDNQYYIEVTGTFRPTALSESNTTTPLTQFYYPLFLAGTLVAAFAYQRDWSAAADDPRTALSWQAEYEMQKAVAVGESKRQKSHFGGYSAVAVPMPMPTAGPMATALRGHAAPGG